MSTDYQVLIQKFNNFRKFVCEICKDEQVLNEYKNMSENTFLLFGLGFLLPNKDKLPLIAEKVCDKIKVSNDDHKKKISRYFECFCEYLEQINNKDTAESVLKGALDEKGITEEDLKTCQERRSIDSIQEKLSK